MTVVGCQGVDPTAARLALEQLVADEQQRAAEHEAGRRAALDAVLEEVDADEAAVASEPAAGAPEPEPDWHRPGAGGDGGAVGGAEEVGSPALSAAAELAAELAEVTTLPRSRSFSSSSAWF